MAYETWDVDVEGERQEVGGKGDKLSSIWKLGSNRRIVVVSYDSCCQERDGEARTDARAKGRGLGCYEGGMVEKI